MTDTTLVTFLLDRSGSMGKIWDETIGGFNVYLETLQKGGTAIKFTLLQFDTGGIDKCCVADPVANVKPLDRMSYQPRGGTPLIDAAFKTIAAVEDSLAKYDTVPKVIVCIQTDGEENSSTEHTWEELKSWRRRPRRAGSSILWAPASTPTTRAPAWALPPPTP
jgi:hypothetical protein